MSASIQWTGADAMIRALENYERQIYQTVRAVADYFAPIIEAQAKQDAPWTDRTGNARQSLFTVVEEIAGEIVVLYLSHGMDYGKWLELAHQGKYHIVLPTLEAHYEPIMNMLREALG